MEQVQGTQPKGIEQLRSETIRAFVDAGKLTVSTSTGGIEGAFVRKPAKNGTDFMYAKVDEPKWDIPNLVRYCAKLVIGGKQKTGKTKLAMFLVLSYLTGRELYWQP